MFIKASELFKGEHKDERVFFCVTETDVQITARQKIQRELTEEELRRVAKGVEYGLSEGMDVVLDTAISLRDYQ